MIIKKSSHLKTTVIYWKVKYSLVIQVFKNTQLDPWLATCNNTFLLSRSAPNSHPTNCLGVFSLDVRFCLAKKLYLGVFVVGLPYLFRLPRYRTKMGLNSSYCTFTNREFKMFIFIQFIQRMSVTCTRLQSKLVLQSIKLLL